LGAFVDGHLARIEDTAQVAVMLDRLMVSDWVVYSKSSTTDTDTTDTETMVDYLGRYSHRIAVSNRRILSFEDGRVDLMYKDTHLGFPANRCQRERLG
jgi:hypothetical protein